MAKTKPKTNECKYISPEEKKKNEIIKKQKAKKQKKLAAELGKKKKGSGRNETQGKKTDFPTTVQLAGFYCNGKSSLCKMH